MNEDLRLHGLIGTGGGSNIKSIQRGSFIGNVLSKNVTITSIDPQKSIVIIDALDYPFDSATQTGKYYFDAEIINNTTLLFERLTNDTTLYPTVYWTVIEYNNAKSKQSGILDVNSQTIKGASVTIAAVNRDKSILVISKRHTADGNEGAVSTNTLADAVLTNGTTITFHRNGATFFWTWRFKWQVIEFS